MVIQRDPASAHLGSAGAFARYSRWYPNTPNLLALAGGSSAPDASDEFQKAWIARAAPPALPDARYLLVRGLFGALIPGHFRAARRALRDAGLRVDIAPGNPLGLIDDNVARLVAYFRACACDDRPLIILAHSRGGLESLLALQAIASRRRLNAAIVLCQTARAPSPALHEILVGTRWSERPLRLALRAGGALPACREIDDPATGARARSLDDTVSALPAISVATWSAQPSRSLEAQHVRIGRLAPGVAHDGLFFTQDLIWPTATQVLLADVDHAQPGVGGGGFDSGRFWLTLAALAARRFGTQLLHQRSSAGSESSAAAG